MTRFGRASMAGGALLALLAFTASLPAPIAAQTAELAVPEENFRAEPRGEILAELLPGAELRAGADRGQWREVTLEAWIWARSVQDQQGALDLIVNAGGENLRASPNGERVGRAHGGMRLERVETRDGWIRARRTGWIWAESVRVDSGSPGAGEGVGAGSRAAPPSAPARGVVSSPARRERASVADGAVLLDAPAGDTVARLRRGPTVEVLAREGDWSRIRIEGWTFSGGLVGPDSLAGQVLVDLPRDSMEAHPERYRGRLVEWTIQFIALQEAERFRTDFLEGEPFMLTRGPGDDPGFVYVAVPLERRGEVERLAPLQTIRVLGRVRAARSSLTGAPVLDLVEISGR